MADFIFLPSEFAKKTFVEAGFDPARLFVIERAVDSERYRPGGGAGKGRFRVVFVGRVSLRKGVQYLLEAWRGVDIKGAELVIVGGVDEDMGPVLAKYGDMDNVVFKGHVKDTSEVYGGASVFVFPSLEEGSAKVTFEAMASGLPVVTTENSGSVVRDGVDGFIVPARDAGALRERMLCLYEDADRARLMGQSGRGRAGLYTWQRYRETLLKAYGRITGNR
jgi:glycosyltransferase involved in cell wall biosynthesis